MIELWLFKILTFKVEVEVKAKAEAEVKTEATYS